MALWVNLLVAAALPQSAPRLVADALPRSAPLPIAPQLWYGAGNDRTSAYPPDRANILTVDLTIDSRGYVTDCTIARSSGLANIDERTCRLLKMKARYEPARDDKGQAISGSETRNIVWPKPPPGQVNTWFNAHDYPPEALKARHQGSVEVGWEVNEQGTVENCVILKGSGFAELDEVTCRLLVERGRYSPASDDAGRRIRVSFSQVFRWQLPN